MLWASIYAGMIASEEPMTCVPVVRRASSRNITTLDLLTHYTLTLPLDTEPKLSNIRYEIWGEPPRKLRGSTQRQPSPLGLEPGLQALLNRKQSR